LAPKRCISSFSTQSADTVEKVPEAPGALRNAEQCSKFTCQAPCFRLLCNAFRTFSYKIACQVSWQSFSTQSAVSDTLLSRTALFSAGTVLKSHRFSIEVWLIVQPALSVERKIFHLGRRSLWGGAAVSSTMLPRCLQFRPRHFPSRSKK